MSDCIWVLKRWGSSLSQCWESVSLTVLESSKLEAQVWLSVFSAQKMKVWLRSSPQTLRLESESAFSVLRRQNRDCTWVFKPWGSSLSTSPQCWKSESRIVFTFSNVKPWGCWLLLSRLSSYDLNNLTKMWMSQIMQHFTKYISTSACMTTSQSTNISIRQMPS